MLIEPTYESSSTLRIEPSPDLFGPSVRGNDAGFEQYLETQRALILSNLVLEPAIAKLIQGPGYQSSSFPVIRDSTDPKADVRKRLDVKVIPGTYLIQVSFSSPSAIEAAEIVNQVVSAFEQQSRLFNEGMNEVLRNNYVNYFDKLDRDIQQKQEQMIRLAERIDRQAAKTAAKVEKSRPDEADAARPTSRADELKITFIRDELTNYNEMKNIVRRKIEQLQFESQKGAAKVEVVDSASASKTPQSDSRSLWMAVLPAAVLVSLLGFFLVLDAKSHSRTSAGRNSNQP